MGRTAKINIGIITMTAVTIVIASVIAPPITGIASSSFKSCGKIVFTNGTTTTRDDVIFDSEDFQRLAAVCR